MRILVTGGAGYIGSILVPMLLKEGHRVTVIDNFMYNQSSLLDVCHDENLHIVRGSVLDKFLIMEYMRDTDVVIPLACLTGAPICKQQPLLAKEILLDSIKQLLEFKSQSQLIIFPTTNSGYGTGTLCTEKTPLNPISLYAELKCEAEKLVLQADGITLRLATAFGISPRMRLDLLVNDFVYRAINDKFVVLFESHFHRNYIHVRDIARAFIHCIDNYDTMKGEAYNVGLSDANLTKMELCQKIKEQIPDFYFVEAEVGEDVDKRDYIVCNEKIESTGFRPSVTLEDGITELIKGYQIIKRNQYANV